MKAKQTSNYDKWCEQWRQRFLSMDQAQLMQLLPELKVEGDFLTIVHFGKKYGIHRRQGHIVSLEDVLPVSTTVQLNIYTLFGYVSPTALFRDEWVPFEKLRSTSPFAAAFHKGIITPFARTFSGHMDALQSAFESLGGVRLPHSDLGYQIKAFECIPMRFLFWEGDEDFPAQANILFDKSATDFIHGESIVTIASLGLHRLAEEAGLLPDKGAF